jgi:hypothetical protein
MTLAKLNSPPNEANLSAAFGFPAPKSFVEFMSVIYELSDGNWHDGMKLFARSTGRDLVTSECRYTLTPPELCPFASMGVDGDHDGYVIHAPELGNDDYPVGGYVPMDSCGVWLIGNNTIKAIEHYLSCTLEFEGKQITDAKDAQTLRSVQVLAQTLRIDPTAERAYENSGPDGRGLPIIPKAPVGWRFLPSSDGVGVLAPEAAFGPDPLLTCPMEPVDSVRIADDAFSRNYPAAALYYLREAFWNTCDVQIQQGICRRLILVYHALSRPFLAEVVANKLKCFFDRDCEFRKNFEGTRGPQA